MAPKDSKARAAGKPTKAKATEEKSKQAEEESKAPPPPDPESEDDENGGSRSGKEEEIDGNQSEDGQEQEIDEEESPKITMSKAQQKAAVQVQTILTNMSKNGKFDISTKAGLERLESWLQSNLSWFLTPEDRKTIWDAAFTAEDKVNMKFIILDLKREYREIAASEEEPYHNWAGGKWYGGGQHTATVEQMLRLVTNFLIPRCNNKSKAVEAPVTQQRKEAAIEVAKRLCDVSL